MAETKRIMISLPNSLLQEVDGLLTVENKNRSEFIREAMKLYISERKKIQMGAKMKEGYEEMSQINLTLSEIGLEDDMKELDKYEAKLMRCD